MPVIIAISGDDMQHMCCGVWLGYAKLVKGAHLIGPASAWRCEWFKTINVAAAARLLVRIPGQYATKD